MNISFVTSVVSVCLSLDFTSRNFIKICRYHPDLAKLGQKCRTLYVKNGRGVPFLTMHVAERGEQQNSHKALLCLQLDTPCSFTLFTATRNVQRNKWKTFMVFRKLCDDIPAATMVMRTRHIVYAVRALPILLFECNKIPLWEINILISKLPRFVHHGNKLSVLKT